MDSFLPTVTVAEIPSSWDEPFRLCVHAYHFSLNNIAPAILFSLFCILIFAFCRFFPISIKYAVIYPILNTYLNTSIHTSLPSYHLISNLAFMAKLIKTVVYTCCFNCCLFHSLLSPPQVPFHSHSCRRTAHVQLSGPTCSTHCWLSRQQPFLSTNFLAHKTAKCVRRLGPFSSSRVRHHD